MIRRKKIGEPPPAIDSARVLWYAIKSEEVVYKSRSTLYVGGRLLGEVPCLAVCDNRKICGDFLLLLCNTDWEALGAAGADSVEEAKEWAEREYIGISKQWIKVKYSKREADKYLATVQRENEEYWAGICTEVQRKLSGRVVDCCVCKKIISNPGENFNFRWPEGWGKNVHVPRSHFTNLRNVDCYHSECEKQYNLERGILSDGE